MCPPQGEPLFLDLLMGSAKLASPTLLTPKTRGWGIPKFFIQAHPKTMEVTYAKDSRAVQFSKNKGRITLLLPNII